MAEVAIKVTHRPLKSTRVAAPAWIAIPVTTHSAQGNSLMGGSLRHCLERHAADYYALAPPIFLRPKYIAPPIKANPASITESGEGSGTAEMSTPPITGP